MPKLRLFFALETPLPIRTSVATLLGTLQESGADVRWEPTSKLHSTLRFLGDTDPQILQSLSETASRLVSASPPPRILYHGVGAFPDTRHPRVVWVGMEDIEGTLQTLHRELDRGLATLGIEPETRAFHPHLTLGRVRGERNLHHLIRLLENCTFESEPASLKELLLMKSDLHPSGSVYTILQAFPFGTR